MMIARRALGWLVAMGTTLVACGGSPPPPTPPPPPKPAAAPKPVASKPPEPPPAPEVSYEARGRRDPFESPDARQAGAGGGPTVTAARLTGIVRGSRTTLALVETADGIGYILKTGDTLGDGRLVEIGADSVVFTVVPKPGSTTNRVTLKLASN